MGQNIDFVTRGTTNDAKEDTWHSVELPAAALIDADGRACGGGGAAGPLPGDLAAHEGHEGWTDLSALSGTELTLEGGSYYLDADRALKSVTIEGDVTLCLNGKTLSWEGAASTTT